MCASNVGALYVHRLWLYGISTGSKHTLRVPLPFWGYVSKLTKGVGSTYGDILHCHLPQLCFNLFFGPCEDSAPSVFHWWDGGTKCEGVLVWHTVYLVKGIWGHVLQILNAVDGFMVL